MKKIMIYIFFLLLTKNLYFVEVEDLESEKTGVLEYKENNLQEDNVISATSNLHHQEYVKTQKEENKKNKREEIYEKEEEKSQTVVTEFVETKSAPVCALTPVNDSDICELKKTEEVKELKENSKDVKDTKLYFECVEQNNNAPIDTQNTHEH